MRTLKQITDAVRRNEEATTYELRFALVAYDVLLAKMNIAQDQQQVAEFFQAAEAPPADYVGWANAPENPEFVGWHRTHVNNRPEVFERALEMLDDDPFGALDPIVPTGPHCPKCGKQEAAGNYSLELMSPEQQAVAPLWECMSCHHAWGHGDGAGPLTVHKTASVGITSTVEAWPWSALGHEKKHKVDIVRPVTICTVCTRLHTLDECPHCLDAALDLIDT